MHLYIEPVMTAAWFFPFVAALITFPYMVLQYRRYGSILLLRTTILYSFIQYLMCAYFLTMLPLPSREEVASLTTPYLQLTPFADVVAWIRDSGFVITQPATWKKLIVNRDLFVMVANVAMTIPFGIYLRYYFGFSLRKTLAFSLALSLVFELTQLSALFGLYPRPYRLCETDDLITNTLGGALGYWLAKPLMRVLPSRQRMDEIAYRRGTHVSVTRRITAALVDWSILGFCLILAAVFNEPLRNLMVNSGYATGLTTLGVQYLIMVTLYFIFGEWLQRGRTLGKRLTHLRLVDDRDGSRPKLWQCAVRYASLYFGFIPLPFAALLLFIFALHNGSVDWLALTFCIVLMLIYVTLLVMIVIGVINRSNQLPHGALSHTRNVSTLILTEEMLYKVGQTLNEENVPPGAPQKDDGPLLNG